MKAFEIQILDPFVLPIVIAPAYYLFGTVMTESLHGWRGIRLLQQQRPHRMGGAHACVPAATGFLGKIAVLGARSVCAQGAHHSCWRRFSPGRVTAAHRFLAANRPEGPYKPWSDGPVTPPTTWMYLDGTMHIGHDEPQAWLVFCHEWCQIRNGSICAVRLSADLRRAEGQPVYLFNATDAPWVRCLTDKENSGSHCRATGTSRLT